MCTPQGSIHIIIGPMFSGKSTELLRRMRRYAVAQQRTMLIKYAKDTRYGIDGVITHDHQRSTAKACSSLAEVEDSAMDYDVIGIDEGQFFPDLVNFCEEAANQGKTVIVAALDGTFQRKPFPNVMELIPLSEAVDKLQAVCVRCFKDASFSKRLGTETQVEVIGGSDKYVAVCRECYFKTDPQTPTAPSSPPEEGQRPLRDGIRRLNFD